MPTRPYKAPRLLRNPHLQSMLSSLPMRRAGGQRALQRSGAVSSEHIIDAGDGVRLAGTHSAVPGRAPRALVLLLHGWEGSSQSGYMCHTAAHLIGEGFDVFRLNFRDHGDTHHLNEGLFHSCRLAEVVQAAKWVAENFPAPRFLAAGYSLGGNFALRLALAAPDAGIPLLHAAAVCPAVDPSAVMRTLESGPALYHWYFMKKWRGSLRKKRALFPLHHDFDEATLAQDMRGLTHWLVKRHTDKHDVEDYFAGYAVAGGRLAALQIPVSVLAAADDPVIPIDTLKALQLPAHSTLEIAEHGGHCGFIEGASLRGYSERWVAARLSAAIA
ncbi:MAG TPA: alpha/beta fold hydrolase [Arenimonas sp.]|uniref:YheT family hydrolase n=1 Tax=Arenimonas sp. TaxID=1872635 RepID=UPI002BED198A|nr:alpha/beta fold hydrolase [Arenimonas sp.]HMB57348.1 alpha/beta fold hydrolase [Arenimonas sp.]